MGAPIIWNGKFAKLMTNLGLKFSNGFRQHAININPQNVSTEASKGDVLFSSSGIFQKQDDGTTTNWKKINDVMPFKVYDNFEMETVGALPSGWTKYGNTNASLNYPDNFGGSASSSSYVTTASTGLTGANLFRMAISSSDNGKGVYKQFSISNGEKGLPFILDAQININKTGSANWASNAQVWVVGSNDNFVSNFQNIALTINTITESGYFRASFTDSTKLLTSFRLCIHFFGLTDTFNLDIDDIKVFLSNADTMASIYASSENDLDFRIRKSSTQSILNNTWAEVVFNSISKGNPSLIDLVNGRITLKPNARYAISFNIAIGNFGSVGIELRKNGVQVLGEYYDGQNSTANIERTWIVDTDGNASTDYYSLWFYQSLGSTQTINTASFLNAIRLDKPFSMNLFQASGMVLSPTDNVLPAQFYKSANQSIANATLTKLQFDSTQFNPTGLFQLDAINYRVYNRGNAGYFDIECLLLGIGASTNWANFNLQLYINGVNTTTRQTAESVFTNIYLAKDSYIEVYLFHNLGSSQSVSISLNINRKDKTAVSAGGGYTKWQTKTQSTDFTTNGVISSLTFNNLEIGKTYRCNTAFMMDIFNNTAVTIASNQGFSVLVKHYVPNTSTEAIDNCDRSIIFVASATTLTFTSSNFASTQYLRGGSSVTLEELPQHIQTTQWT